MRGSVRSVSTRMSSSAFLRIKMISLLRWPLVVLFSNLLWPTLAAGESRVALVIGNSDYKEGKLANPVNDARAMAARLRALGFDVALRENLKLRQIGGDYNEFRSKITLGTVPWCFMQAMAYRSRA